MFGSQFGARRSCQVYSSRRTEGRNSKAIRMAHFPAHVFFIAQSKQNRYQGDTRTPSPRLQPGHVGYIYPSRHSSEAASAEQRHSSSPGAYNGRWLRPVCWEVFLICACSKWRDRCENTAASMKCIRVDAESCSFFVPIYKEEENRKLLKRLGVPDGI